MQMFGAGVRRIPEFVSQRGKTRLATAASPDSARRLDKAVFFNPVAQGVAADAQDARRAGDVPTRLVQGLYERIALKFIHRGGRGEGDWRPGAWHEFACREADLRGGRDILRAAFEESLDPIVTPRWNRVTPATLFMQAGLGVATLSRDVTAPEQHALPEVVVHTDGSKQSPLAEPVQDDAAQRIANELARHVAPDSRVRLMLHHAMMRPAELDSLRKLLAAWALHPSARWLPMIALAEHPHAAPSLG